MAAHGATTTLDVARVRADFPILERVVNGYPLAYLDNGATTQKPRAVLEAMDDYYRRYNANVHRGVHTLSVEATEAMEDARTRIARFINATSSREVIFTRGTTEAINLVAWSWGRAHLRPGDEIVISEIEHHANIVPWQLVAQHTGAVIRAIPVTDAGELDYAAYRDLLTPLTRIVAVTAMSNVLGSITDVAAIRDPAHAIGALVLLDGAQSVPHLPTDVRALDVDFLTFSAHKMLGPTGIGVLWGREALLKTMPPWQGGGDMIRTVSLDGSTWNELPWKFEAGTPAIAEAIGFGAAIDYLADIGMGAFHERERQLTAYALERLTAIDGLRLFGPLDPQRRGGVLSFALDGIHPHDIGTVLDQRGIAIRAGHHCAQPLMRRLGVPATARASLYVYSTEDEIDRLADGLREVQRRFLRTPAALRGT